MSYTITTIIRAPMSDEEVDAAVKEFPHLPEEEAVAASAAKLESDLEQDFPNATVVVSTTKE
jgi:hypothetical protein